MQFWYALLLGAALAGFGAIAYHQQKSSALKQIDLALEREMTVIVASLRSGIRPPRDGDAGRSPSPSQRGRAMAEFAKSEGAKAMVNENGLEDDYIVVWGRLGTELGRLGAIPGDVPAPENPGDQNTYSLQRTRGDLREIYRFLGPGDCVLFGKSIRPELQQVSRVAWKLTGTGVGILALGLVGGWFFLSRSIRPIRTISETAREYASGKLNTRIPHENGGGELGQLTQDLNETFDQLEKAFARQGRFTADAAHELRTPVTVILSQAQAALARDRDGDAYKDALRKCERGADRLRRLIDSLLTLTSLDAEAIDVPKEEIDLAGIAQECGEFMGPLLEERRLFLGSELEAAKCLGNADQLRQVLTNLIANAINFSSEGGTVRATTGSDGETAWAKVTDEGKGIAPEHLPHLFERFYRADAARNRQTGGAGLGLAICDEIVKSHGGTINVESEVDAGTTFTVEIPANSGGSEAR